MEATNQIDYLEYKVQLPVFEGPLDLLLHLIKKDDLNIYDIPIATILGQYLDYLQLARELDIDLAGEFLDMAAELAYIKSKMLLPEPPEEAADEGPDPRVDLIARLLEYQQYKQAAGWLTERPLLGRDVFTHPPFLPEEGLTEASIEADPLALMSAFSEILKKLPQEGIHEVRGDRMGVTERVVQLMAFLQEKGAVTFESIFEGVTDRPTLIVTFLALLEMAKQRIVRLVQNRSFESIVISPLFSAEEKGEVYAIEENH